MILFIGQGGASRSYWRNWGLRWNCYAEMGRGMREVSSRRSCRQLTRMAFRSAFYMRVVKWWQTGRVWARNNIGETRESLCENGFENTLNWWRCAVISIWDVAGEFWICVKTSYRFGSNGWHKKVRLWILSLMMITIWRSAKEVFLGKNGRHCIYKIL